MKKHFIMGLLCLLVSQLSAQKLKFDFDSEQSADESVSPAVRENVYRYAIEIREIVIKEKLSMKDEIDRVNQDLEDGKISSDEAENLKANIALKFSDKINSSIAQLKFDLDDIIKEQVKFSILNTDVENLQSDKVLVEKTYKTIIQLTGYLAYGVISLPKGDDELLNSHLGYSSGIDAGLIYNRQLSRTSPFVFKTGLYLSWRTTRFNDNYYISKGDDGQVNLVNYNQNLEKSKLRATYLVVPVGVKYSFNKIKTDVNGSNYRDPDKGLGITANIFGGVKISNNNIVKGDGISIRHRKPDFNLNEFIYGGQLALNIYNWNFFVRQELSPYFRDGTFDNRKLIQFGINFGF